MPFTFEPDAMPSYVTEGALFMDAIDPDWFWTVDPEKLDMENGDFWLNDCGCVLAQHNPDLVFAPHRYGLGWSQAVELGFNVSDDWDDDESELTRLWQDEINDRRAAALERVG